MDKQILKLCWCCPNHENKFKWKDRIIIHLKEGLRNVKQSHRQNRKDDINGAKRITMMHQLLVQLLRSSSLNFPTEPTITYNTTITYNQLKIHTFDVFVLWSYNKKYVDILFKSIFLMHVFLLGLLLDKVYRSRYGVYKTNIFL